MLIRTVALSLLTTLIVGCQTDRADGPSSVTLAEAKEITAEIEKSGRVQPPRSISDVLKVLREPSGKDAERLKRYREIADLEAPSIDDLKTESTKRWLAGIAVWDLFGAGTPSQGLLGRHNDSSGNSEVADDPYVAMVRFYQSRGRAASFLGRTDQALSDLKLALKFAVDNPDDEERQLVKRIGAVYWAIGEFEQAAQYFEESYDSIVTNAPIRRAMAKATLASIYADLGRLDDAKEELNQAQSHEVRGYRNQGWGAWSRYWMPSSGAQVKTSEGHVAFSQGRNAEAKALFKDAVKEISADIAETTDQANWTIAPGGETLREMQLDILLRSQNLLAMAHRQTGQLKEAELEARKALAIYVTEYGRNGSGTATALLTLTEIIMDQARYEEARLLAKEALDLFDRLGAEVTSYPVARAKRVFAAALAAENSWSKSADAYLELETALKKRPRTQERLLADDLTWAVAYVRAGESARAEGHLRKIHDKRSKLLGDDHFDTAEAGALLATTLTAQNRNEEAKRLFAGSVPMLLQRSSTGGDRTTTASLRQRRLLFVLENYIRLLSQSGGEERAFELAEIARAQSVQRALSASAARAALRDPELADLARREQDTRQQISALYGLLASNPTGQGSGDLKQRINRLQAAQTTIAGELKRRFPAYSDLIDPKPATLADAKAVLARNEALIATLVGETETYVWAVNGAGKMGFHVAPLGREELSQRVAVLRRALEPSVSTIGDIPAFRVGDAHALYRALMQPLEGVWTQAENLIVVPHGPLGSLPFSLLTTKDVDLPKESAPLFARYRQVPWLIRSHAVSNVPSVAALRSLRNLPSAGSGREAFKGFGDPLFSAKKAASTQRQPDRGSDARRRHARLRSAPRTRAADSADLSRLPQLPETAEELRSIAAALGADPEKDVFTGVTANEQRVKTMDLGGTRVLAFATHGLVPGDLDGLRQPALALSAPEAAKVPGDGLLQLDEILGLKLNADWVVLSACNTAAAEGAGAEAVSGLGRAFFYAGTRALLASNWPVETVSARDLTTTLFRLQAASPGMSRAAALQRTMQALIDGPGRVENTKTLYSHAHPLFWAPFSIYGEGGIRPSS